MVRSFSGIAIALGLSSAGALGQPVQLQFKPSGALNTLRGYEIQTLQLSATRPESVKKLPADVTAAEFGTLKLGPAERQTLFTFVLTGGDTSNPRLLVDANADGDLTNDPVPEWKDQIYKGSDDVDLHRYQGGADLQLPLGKTPQTGRISFFRFDPSDKSRPSAKGKLFYYRDYGYEGKVQLGQYPYRIYLSDEKATGDFRGDPRASASGVKLYIDVNGNNFFDKNTEVFDIRKPFKVGAATYEIKDMSASGESFVIVPQGQDPPKVETPPPAPVPAPVPPVPAVAKSDLRIGSPALTFKAKGRDGKEINFPGDYKGKIVLLDFWATWCGPCRAEVPNLVSTYNTYHDKGFEILGISLDKANGEQKLADYTTENKMPWVQVFDGKYWSAEIAVLYNIHSIPAAFLVDGDTGKILCTKETLRGQSLAREVDSAIKKKSDVK